MLKKIFNTDSSNWVLTILRVTAGLVMFPHGAQKAIGWFGGAGFTGTMGFFTEQLGIPAVFAALAIIAEFAGSLGLILGFISRIAAFGVAVTMVVAVLMVHLNHGFFMNWMGSQSGEGFEYHILILGLLIPVIFKGAGAWSVDSKLS